MGQPHDVFRNPASAFAAELSGLQNFFAAELLPEIEKGLRKVILNDVILLTHCDLEAGAGAVVIDEKQIFLSKTLPQTSAQNSLKGTVKQTQKTPFGYEIEIACGIDLIVNISESSFDTLNLTPGSEVYASFKVSAIRFFRT